MLRDGRTPPRCLTLYGSVPLKQRGGLVLDTTSDLSTCLYGLDSGLYEAQSLNCQVLNRGRNPYFSVVRSDDVLVCVKVKLSDRECLYICRRCSFSGIGKQYALASRQHTQKKQVQNRNLPLQKHNFYSLQCQGTVVCLCYVIQLESTTGFTRLVPHRTTRSPNICVSFFTAKQLSFFPPELSEAAPTTDIHFSFVGSVPDAANTNNTIPFFPVGRELGNWKTGFACTSSLCIDAKKVKSSGKVLNPGEGLGLECYLRTFPARLGVVSGDYANPGSMLMTQTLIYTPCSF